MEKKEHLLFLIESEIRATQLIELLPEYDIDFFDVYLADYSTLIFELLDIDSVHRTEELYSTYFSLVRKGKPIDLVNDKETLEQLTSQIYTYLIKYRDLCSGLKTPVPVG
ncbi:MAG TPA: hypothetical protein DCX27_11645 [Balneola sp.]|nr:hypothetical protein [Balneola sp.]|tara:strand:+ start:1658 stop:1987 length:330 start_codon:yes stop_codon:yes gene_type:complete